MRIMYYYICVKCGKSKRSFFRLGKEKRFCCHGPMLPVEKDSYKKMRVKN